MPRVWFWNKLFAQRLYPRAVVQNRAEQSVFCLRLFVGTFWTVIVENRREIWYNKFMNGYDFDDTIFRGNSMRRFSLFCTLRLPYLLLYLPVLLVAFLLRGLRILNKNAYLLLLEGFVLFVPNVEKFAAKFWDKNLCRIKSWYLAQKRDDDVIVSATPSFVVGEACRRLGVRCIATDFSPKGKLTGKHCHGKYKVQYFCEQTGNAHLASFYSDSASDKPMWLYAEKGYRVKGDKITLIYENGVKII